MRRSCDSWLEMCAVIDGVVVEWWCVVVQRIWMDVSPTWDFSAGRHSLTSIFLQVGKVLGSRDILSQCICSTTQSPLHCIHHNTSHHCTAPTTTPQSSLHNQPITAQSTNHCTTNQSTHHTCPNPPTMPPRIHKSTNYSESTHLSRNNLRTR